MKNSKKNIALVGINIPSNEHEAINFRSNSSILDSDIIVFQPSFSIGTDYSLDYPKLFQGKYILDETGSFQFNEDAIHWNTELNTALDHGKNIFLYMNDLIDFYTHTGRKETSGTGRNSKTTRIVDLKSNYMSIPIPFTNVIPKNGKEIKISSDLGVLAEYWQEFKDISSFRLYLDSEIGKTILTTKTGNKPVGFIFQKKDPKSGKIIALPPIDFNQKDFTTIKKGEEYWSTKALEVGNKLISFFFNIDKALKSEKISTPPPIWISNSLYKSAKENEIKNKIEETQEKIKKLDIEKNKLESNLREEEELKQLLYETGKPLEKSILKALNILGFKADGYREGESEFDAIFTSPEGRFLGEAEGKDNKQVAIEKMSQLERNIQEDFKRDQVNEPAKAVLFGNAFRLTPPEERQGSFFTDKCILGAKRTKTALIATTKLFIVANYLKDTNDEEFAKKCREQILKTEGEEVNFPAIPLKIN